MLTKDTQTTAVPNDLYITNKLTEQSYFVFLIHGVSDFAKQQLQARDSSNI